jgi:hypothetical protein
MKRTFFNFACILSFSFIITVLNTTGAIATTADASSWFIDMNRFSVSAHGTFTCDACHGKMTEENKKHPDLSDTQILKRDATGIYEYLRCKACHRKSYERYLLGEHTRALEEEQQKVLRGHDLEAGRKKAPTCGICHSAHYLKSHLSRTEIGRQMTDICGSCHLAQKITYLENFHGKRAVNLGNEASAYCTDCHGAHNCVSLKKKKDALLACQRCHPEAEENFAEFVIHPTTKDLKQDDTDKRARVAVIKAVTAVMLILVILVVGFFYGHSFLWLLRDLHEKLRKH